MREEDGCTVYDHWSATCFYYPLGPGTIKRRNSDDKRDFDFPVNEPFCQGHGDELLLQLGFDWLKNVL